MLRRLARRTSSASGSEDGSLTRMTSEPSLEASDPSQISNDLIELVLLSKLNLDAVLGS